MTRFLPITVCLIAIGSSAARADFNVVGYPYPGAVNDVYEFYALNDGTNGTGTRIASAEVTLLNDSPYWHGGLVHGFVFKFVDNSGIAPADLTGVALYEANGNNPAVLFGGHQDRTFTNLLGNEPTADPTLYHVTATQPPNENFIYILPVYVVGQAGFVTGGVDATALSNGGRGALIAVGVVQHGDPIEAAGRVQGMSGEASLYDVYFPMPEPSSATVLGLGVGALILRRRRAAAAAGAGHVS
jgi:hypothetical protein